MPGANLTDIAKRLRTLQVEAEDFNRKRTAIRSEAASGNWKHEWLSQFGDAVPVEADVVARAVEFLAHWNSLPLEERRDIIQGTYKVTVVKGGKGARRVKVELI